MTPVNIFCLQQMNESKKIYDFGTSIMAILLILYS